VREPLLQYFSHRARVVLSHFSVEIVIGIKYARRGAVKAANTTSVRRRRRVEKIEARCRARGGSCMSQVKYDFSGKNVLVIGGTTGIGRATALAFARAGAKLFVAGLGADEGRSLGAEIKDIGGDIEFREVDVRDGRAMKRLHDEAFERFDRIDVAFNNAGVSGKTAPVQELDDADYALVMEVNLRGIFYGLKNQIPHMTAKGGGAIVNTSSLFGVMGFATTAVYCASKWGVIGLTNSAALEVARKNIRINAIAPGSVMTPLIKNMFGGEQEAKNTVLPVIPMGRISDPSEIAQLVLFLSSDAASFITGQAIVIDGGGFVAGADQL
jgi:NAD(P)-dependent dehydrogenase (short-subunit alcohol dehydrogenase family)